MNDINNCIFTGRLTRDPELRYTASGKAITSTSLAVNRSWKKDGEWMNKTVYIDLNLWNGQGEALARICQKGDLLSVIAEYEVQEWDDKTTSEKRRSPRFNVTSWNKLAGTSGNKGESRKAEELDSTSPQNAATDDDDEGIPF